MPELKRKRHKSATPPPPPDLKLRRVILVIPDREPARTQLMEDLASMGCQGLAEKPWGFREQRVVKELLVRPNQYDNSDRGNPGRWTEALWRAVYHFRTGGYGMANRKLEYVHGKFHGPVNPKDGYSVDDCIDERQKRML